RPGVVRWTEGESARRVMVEIVDGDYFEVLGVKPRLGRFFAADEVVTGSAVPVAVVSFEFWQERLGGDAAVLGRTLRLDGREFTVIGVAPEGLLGRFLRLKVDAWVPIGLPGGIYHSTPGELANRGAREYMVYGRLRAGLSLEQAQTRLNVVAARLHETFPEAWVDDRGESRVLTVLAEKDSRIPPDGRAAMAGVAGFLLAGAAFILLIACINVAGLFLARAFKRQREISVRLSLGAGRARIIRLLLVEALLLALAGGALGLGLASFTARFMSAIPFPLDVPLAFGVDLDVRVLGFALATSLLTCLAFGLLPALRASRTDLVSVMKGDETGIGGRRLRLRGALVTLQVACSLMFLVATGLCLRSSGALAAVDPALDPAGIAIASWANRDAELSPADARQRILDMAERLAASPEIGAVAVASVAELSVWTDNASAVLSVDGFEPGPSPNMTVRRNAVTPGYFEMVGMRPVRGRVLEPGDGAGAAPVALVNEAFVRTYWPGESGLGRRFTILEGRTFGKPSPTPLRTVEVVGVLPDVVAVPDQEATPYFWTSFLQDYTPMVVFHARGRPDAAAAVPALRRIVQDDVTEVPLVPARTYADLVAFNSLGQRIAVKAFTWSGAFALLLAVMGIYAIVAFAVSRRVKEMAIRQAVGADRWTVLRSVVLDGLRLTGIGAALGLVVVVPIAFLARSALYGVSPVDPLALAGALGVLLVAALAATALPARRAAGIDPMRILRQE
ncbi:MAG: ABC transporter permease, partial [Gemmatimonadota bacterium]